MDSRLTGREPGQPPCPAPRDLLIVIAKEPRLGFSKTRLAADIGADAAQRFAEAALLDTLELAQSSRAPVLIAFAPEDAGPWFTEHAPAAELWPQPEGDLGARMRGAFREGFQRGFERCVMMGMDTPHLPPGVPGAAFQALDSSDVCLGPALDGGYYLLGLKGDQPTLFDDVPWSTSAVLETTRERCRVAGLSLEELSPELDVDDARSLSALQETLLRRPGVAPRTRRVINSLHGDD